MGLGGTAVLPRRGAREEKSSNRKIDMQKEGPVRPGMQNSNKELHFSRARAWEKGVLPKSNGGSSDEYLGEPRFSNHGLGL